MPVEKKDYTVSIYKYIANIPEQDREEATSEFQDEYADAVNDMAAWDFDQKGINTNDGDQP